MARYVDANNYIYVYLLNDGASKIAIHKIVSGVDTEVLTPTAYTGGPIVRVVLNGNYIWIYAGDSQLGSVVTVADTVLQSSTVVGVITTGLNNVIDNFTVWNLTGNYVNLDTYFPTIKTVMPFGDSKTASTVNAGMSWSGFPPFFADSFPALVESPTRIAAGGTTVRDWATDQGTNGVLYATYGAGRPIDLALAAAVGTPNYILCNLGVNDTRYEEGTAHSGATHGGPFDFATWITNYEYILDAFHTKWPNAQIYIMRPWCATADVPTRPADFGTMDDTSIPAIIAARSSFCFLGPDERGFLQGSDNGATYTIDGVHPTPGGYQLTASQWKNMMGIK